MAAGTEDSWRGGDQVDKDVDNQAHIRRLLAHRWRVLEDNILNQSVEIVKAKCHAAAAEAQTGEKIELDVLLMENPHFPTLIKRGTAFFVDSWKESSAEEWFYASYGPSKQFREGTAIPFTEVLDSIVDSFMTKVLQLGFQTCERESGSWRVSIGWEEDQAIFTKKTSQSTQNDTFAQDDSVAHASQERASEVTVAAGKQVRQCTDRKPQRLMKAGSTAESVSVRSVSDVPLLKRRRTDVELKPEASRRRRRRRKRQDVSSDAERANLLLEQADLREVDERSDSSAGASRPMAASSGKSCSLRHATLRPKNKNDIDEEPDDLESVTGSEPESFLVPNTFGKNISIGGSAAEAEQVGEVTQAKMNFEAKLHDFYDVVAKVSSMNNEEHVRDTEAQETDQLQNILTDIDAKVEKIEQCFGSAWDCYNAIQPSELNVSEMKKSIESMKMAVTGAQEAADSATAFLNAKELEAARMNTWRLRQEAVSALETKRSHLQECVSELKTWKPMLMARCDDWQRREVMPIEFSAPPREEGIDLETVPADPLADRLKSLGLIAASAADNMRLPGGAENFIPGVRRVADADVQPFAAGDKAKARKPSKVVVCKGHDERCVIKRSKKTGRRFFCCPLSDVAGGCGFQRWLDRRPPARRGHGSHDSDGAESN